MSNIPLSFQLTAPIPSKKNCRVVLKSGVNIPSKHFRKWHKENLKLLKPIFYEHGQFTIPVRIILAVELGDNRKRDLDNMLTSVLDLLKDSKIIEDDDISHVPNLAVDFIGMSKEHTAIVTIIGA